MSKQGSLQMSKSHREKLISAQGNAPRNHEDEFTHVDMYKGQEQYCIASCLNCLGTCLICWKFWCPCTCTFDPFYKQSNSSYGILQNFGRFVKVLRPGFNLVNPLTEKVIEVNRQTQILSVQQPIITKDNVACELITVVYYRTIDPVKLLYLLGVYETEQSVREIAYAAIRTISGEQLFQQLISDRTTVARQLERLINNQLSSWGIFVQQIFIKDIILSSELVEDLSTVAKTKREQQAMLINAQAAVESAKCFAQAAQYLNTKAAHQIRYLNLVCQIAELENPKIVMVNMQDRYSK